MVFDHNQLAKDVYIGHEFLRPDSPDPQLTAEDIQKLRQVHAWLEELMPMVRKANELMESKAKLLSWGFGGRK